MVEGLRANNSNIQSGGNGSASAPLVYQISDPQVVGRGVDMPHSAEVEPYQGGSVCVHK